MTANQVSFHQQFCAKTRSINYLQRLQSFIARQRWPGLGNVGLGHLQVIWQQKGLDEFRYPAGGTLGAKLVQEVGHAGVMETWDMECQKKNTPFVLT